MVGKKCEICGDKVLILKERKGNRLCLDCLEKAEADEIFVSKKPSKNEGVKNKQMALGKSKRRCTSCGRIIPEDARYCPYCPKKFW